MFKPIEKMLRADFILYFCFCSLFLFHFVCFYSFFSLSPLSHFLLSQEKKNADPAGYLRNKLFELHARYRDLQLIHVIAPGENLDYSLEKSESAIMRESLS